MNQSLPCLGPYALTVIEHLEYFQPLLVASSFFNVVLSISATLGNLLIITAILRSRSLQTPSYLLITSLALTDLLIGLIFHPSLVFGNAFFLVKNFQGICDANLAGSDVIVFFLVGVSLVMNALISIDRYLALSLRHRYRIYVTKKRVFVVIIACWLFVLCIIIGMNQFQRYSQIRNALAITPAFASLLSTCAFYLLSYITLHRYTKQVHVQPRDSLHSNFDVVKYRKTLKTMAAILGCLLVCCLPAAVSTVTFYRGQQTRNIVSAMIISTIIFGASSSINPIIYLTRFTDIRQECKSLGRKALSSCGIISDV